MKKTVIMTIAVICILLAGIAGSGILNREPERRASEKKEVTEENTRNEEVTELNEEIVTEEPVKDKNEEAITAEEDKEPEKNDNKTDKIEEAVEDNKQEEDTEELKEEQLAETSDEKKNETNQVQTSEQREPVQDIDDVINQLEQQEIKNEEAKSITFPYSIPETNLVIRKIEAFDGIFLEDGSDEAVSNVATMLLENHGDSDVEYGEISIKCDDGELRFEVSALPGGTSMIVQEKNKAQYKKGTYRECRAEVAEVGTLEMCEQKVKITEKGNDTLEVTNLTNETIPQVRIFYKYYMEEENVYVGGITYAAKIENLEKGSAQTVTPKHYMDDGSRVVMVRTYEE